MLIQFAGFEWEIGSTSELVSAMHSALGQSNYFGGVPLVLVGRDVERPAWDFVVELARKNSLWRSACGVALQHCVTHGGGLEQTALADVLANYRESMLLLNYTVQLAARVTNARATRANTGLGGGVHNPTVGAVIAEQQKLFPLITSEERQAVVAGGKLIEIPTPAAFEMLLGKTAAQGRAVEHGFGTCVWGWVHEEVFLREWALTALVSYVSRALSGDDLAPIAAALDWLSDGHRIEAFASVLHQTITAEPTWLAVCAKHKPPKWKRPIRLAPQRDITTYGDLLLQLSTMAKSAAVPPTEDLERIY